MTHTPEQKNIAPADAIKPPNPPTWVHRFDQAEGNGPNLLGGKGAHLAEMTQLGLPVPPGFVITTKACLEYFESGGRLPDGLWEQALAATKDLEKSTGRGFGDPDDPLLLSVRSGAVVSMPGMMDTILNLGIDSNIAVGIGHRAGDPRFGLDLHRCFIQMYANVVLGVENSKFEQAMEKQRHRAGVSRNADLGSEDLHEVISLFQSMVESEKAGVIPDDPYAQLESAVRAVFESWDTRRAIDYRNFHRIPHDLGTPVNVMAMVYGNADDKSGSGVIFTRDPATGENKLYGEYLMKAQGEEVVAGVATPRPIADLEAEMPEVHRELSGVAEKLESHYRDIQDIEFTIERGRLYILQTRPGKRSAKAAVRFAVDLTREGLLTKGEAVNSVEPEQVYQLLLPRLDDTSKDEARKGGRLVATGLGASSGGATGQVVFTADAAVKAADDGTAVILVRSETSAEDVHGMLAAAGVLTSRGGATSHAAVVARGLGKACVTGTESLEVNQNQGFFRSGDLTIRESDQISIDGGSGEVFLGSVATIQPQVSDEKEMATLLSWADEIRRLEVRANADTKLDATLARELGAQGIGLCRTEHMFFDPRRLEMMQGMILAAHSSAENPEDPAVREAYHSALEELREFQVPDFEGIFRAMDGLPVVIRLLDPPLHEFLPGYEEILAEVVELRTRGDNSDRLADMERLLATVNDMRETNPMLGLRGGRLGLMHPAIYEMQVRAILEAADNVRAQGLTPMPEIMIPLVADGNEMSRLRRNLEETARQYQSGNDEPVHYKIGAMIETPRAALTAGEIAESAEFFSIGTNDLTQMTFGFSRDDAEGKFLRSYVEDRVLDEDPFKVLDRPGVGLLAKIACEAGKSTRPSLELGICGEHGGDPSSIEFFDTTGLDYVSCSPHRVPVARLAAAQATLRSRGLSNRGNPTV